MGSCDCLPWLCHSLRRGRTFISIIRISLSFIRRGVNMNIGDVFTIEGELFYIENMDRRTNHDGMTFTIFLVDETIRNNNIEGRINQQMLIDEQRKAGVILEKVTEEMEEE